MAIPVEVDQKKHQLVHFIPLTIQLALNFNLEQEMQQIHFINSTSLVNNNKMYKKFEFEKGSRDRNKK